MKKYLSHILYLLVIAFFVVYANIKANEAEKQNILALQNARLAETNAKEAERMAERAEAEAAKARMEENRTVQLIKDLENCKSSQK